MNSTDIAQMRLHNQQIAGTTHKTPKDLVNWMGAMQAQDYAMAKWALGVRLSNATDASIEAAISRGEVIRTHLMRPTWHFVSADDIYWMLDLTAPHIKSLVRTRHKELELTEDIFSRSYEIMSKALEGGKHLTRKALGAALEKANIATHSQRLYHLVLRAELDGILCSGPPEGKQPTYVLLEESVPEKQTLVREEALARLARKYFTSHAPATLRDFVWWSGLPVKDARQAVEIIKPDFISETIHEATYWLTNDFSQPQNKENSVHLLPAFDEFIISYKDRSATISSGHHKKAVSSNGVFRPIIVVDGQVAGIWKRILKKDKVIITPTLFQPPAKHVRRLFEKEATAFGDFLGMKVEIHDNAG